MEIAVQDLTTKYIKNPPAIKIYAIVGNQSAAYPTVDTFLKEENYTLTMARWHILQLTELSILSMQGHFP